MVLITYFFTPPINNIFDRLQIFALLLQTTNVVPTQSGPINKQLPEYYTESVGSVG